jgi:hypothetical protein
MARWGIPRLVGGRRRTLTTPIWSVCRSSPQPPTSTQSAWGRSPGRRLCWSVPSRASLSEDPPTMLLLSTHAPGGGATGPWLREPGQPTSPKACTVELLLLASCTGGAAAGLAGHGHAPSWCTACLLSLWMAASLPTNALGVANGAPLPTPMGVRAAAPASASPLQTQTAGMRSCHGGRHMVLAGHAPPTLHWRTSGPPPAI